MLSVRLVGPEETVRKKHHIRAIDSAIGENKCHRQAVEQEITQTLERKRIATCNPTIRTHHSHTPLAHTTRTSCVL